MILMLRAAVACSVLSFCVNTIIFADDWRQFRGSDHSSVAADAKLPLEFSAEKNVAWKSPLVGRGVSGPIAVGGKVFVTASSGAVTQNRLHVLCFDAESGKQLWHRQFWATGRCFHHPTSANAAPTPASDGERIFAFYSSNDLVCLDLDGNLLWYRGLGSDYPKAGNDVGMSSSPVVVGDTVVVQVENQGDSFAAGLDTATGENRWRIDRPKEANWASPAALPVKDGKDLVLLQSNKTLAAHDPKSGEQVWSFELACSGIPSSTPSGERIFAPAKGVTALDLKSGETAPSLAWDSNRLATGNASPVIHDGKVYVLASRSGVLTCGDAEKGELLWQLRLSGTFWATPVVANNHLYCVNQDGKVLVVKLGGEKGELVATNELGDTFLASPAVADNGLFLRSDKYLWKIAQKD
jgi:outer membrane protein assembly factor BamB